jgi:DNA-binding winged helix-turn-helix (wHTH) protein
MRLSDDPDKVRFGRFLFDLRRRRLMHDGEPVELSGRALDILRLLALAEGAVVSKDELMTRLWPGRTVAENNLHVHISALRKALDEHGESDTYIITVPGRGYRFIGPIVTEMGQGAMAAPPQVDTAREPAPTPRADAEQRQITAMSCELIGISGGADGVGLEDLRNVVAAF